MVVICFKESCRHSLARPVPDRCEKLFWNCSIMLMMAIEIRATAIVDEDKIYLYLQGRTQRETFYLLSTPKS